MNPWKVITKPDRFRNFLLTSSSTLDHFTSHKFFILTPSAAIFFSFSSSCSSFFCCRCKKIKLGIEKKSEIKKKKRRIRNDCDIDIHIDINSYLLFSFWRWISFWKFLLVCAVREKKFLLQFHHKAKKNSAKKKYCWNIYNSIWIEI